MNLILLELTAEGDFAAWKLIVGGRRSHALSRPLFPKHQPNYDFDHGVRVRIKSLRPRTGALPLDEEFTKRR